jgi:hypothetical protein
MERGTRRCLAAAITEGGSGPSYSFPFETRTELSRFPDHGHQPGDPLLVDRVCGDSILLETRPHDHSIRHGEELHHVSFVYAAAHQQGDLGRRLPRPHQVLYLRGFAPPLTRAICDLIDP